MNPKPSISSAPILGIAERSPGMASRVKTSKEAVELTLSMKTNSTLQLEEYAITMKMIKSISKKAMEFKFLTSTPSQSKTVISVL
jgi:hypothetical protein